MLRFIYYLPRCGHTKSSSALDYDGNPLRSSPFSPASQNLPDFHFMTEGNGRVEVCENCHLGRSRRLSLESREAAKAEFLLLEAEAGQRRAEINERNLVLEEELCNISVESLSLSQARQIHQPYYEFDNVLRYDYPRTPEGIERRRRLENLIVEMKSPLVREFSLGEQLTRAEIFVKRWAENTFDYGILPVDARDARDQLKARTNALIEATDAQDQLLFDSLGATAISHPELTERWNLHKTTFFDTRLRWNLKIESESNDDNSTNPSEDLGYMYGFQIHFSFLEGEGSDG
jgi:hypothetical protein